jgi:hypothetical protein
VTLVRRGDPGRVNQAQRSGFLGRMVEARRVPRERVEAAQDRLEAECEDRAIHRGSSAFWREAEFGLKASSTRRC